MHLAIDIWKYWGPILQMEYAFLFLKRASLCLINHRKYIFAVYIGAVFAHFDVEMLFFRNKNIYNCTRNVNGDYRRSLKFLATKRVQTEGRTNGWTEEWKLSDLSSWCHRLRLPLDFILSGLKLTQCYSYLTIALHFNSSINRCFKYANCYEVN